MEKSDYGLLGTCFKLDNKTNQIKEYEADILCFVLEKDNNPYLERMDDELGFHLITAYPKINIKKPTPTERNLQPIAMQTETFKNATPIQKAYFAYQTDQSLATNCHVAYKGSVGDDMIQVQIFDGNNYNVVNCRDHTQRTTITTYDEKGNKIGKSKDFYGDTNKQIFMQRLFPKETNLIYKIGAYIRKFEGLPRPQQEIKEKLTSNENLFKDAYHKRKDDTQLQ